MSKEKRLRIIGIIVSLVLLLSVIILTNDYFDDLEIKNTILLGLSFSQFGIIVYTLGFNAGKKE